MWAECRLYYLPQATTLYRQPLFTGNHSLGSHMTKSVQYNNILQVVKLNYILTGFTKLSLCSEGLMEVCSEGLMEVCSEGLVEVCSEGLVEVCSEGLVEVCSEGLVEVCSEGLMEACSEGLMEACSEGLMEVWLLYIKL